MLLVIDTSTTMASVAVLDPAQPGVAVSAAQPAQNRHAEVLTPLIEAVLSQAGVGLSQVRRVAVGVGPGPFTGLRVGIVTALTLGAARGIPVVGVCSLDVLALAAASAGVVEDGQLLAVGDARRREVYWARYAVADGRIRRLAGPSVDQPGAVPDAGTLPAVGAGALLYSDVFGPVPGGAAATPDAAVLASAVAGAVLPELDPVPLYLRRPDARPAAPGAPAAGIAAR